MKIRVVCTAALLTAFPLLGAAADGTPPKVTDESREHGGPFVDIADLIERVRKKTGKQFLLDPRLRAEVPVGTLDLDRLDYARLLDILRENMFATYEADGVVVVTVDANARQLPTPVSTSIGPKTLDSELVTLLIHAKNVCSVETVPILRPLMPQAAHLAAMPRQNSLLLVDYASNARRIVDLFERLDKQAGALNQTCAEGKPVEPKAGS
jgi:general secretion pathway protein D